MFYVILKSFCILRLDSNGSMSLLLPNKLVRSCGRDEYIEILSLFLEGLLLCLKISSWPLGLIVLILNIFLMDWIYDCYFIILLSFLSILNDPIVDKKFILINSVNFTKNKKHLSNRISFKNSKRSVDEEELSTLLNRNLIYLFYLFSY